MWFGGSGGGGGGGGLFGGPASSLPQQQQQQQQQHPSNSGLLFGGGVGSISSTPSLTFGSNNAVATATSTNPGFFGGVQQPQPPSISFGGFGASPAPPLTGFGQQQSQPQQPQQSSLAFGTGMPTFPSSSLFSSSTPSGGGTQFGAPSAPFGGNNTFGSPPPSSGTAFPVATTGAFGASSLFGGGSTLTNSATSSTTSILGAPPQAPKPFVFGSTNPAANAGSSFANTSSSTSFGFGSATNTTNNASTPFGFGNTNSSSALTGSTTSTTASGAGYFGQFNNNNFNNTTNFSTTTNNTSNNGGAFVFGTNNTPATTTATSSFGAFASAPTATAPTSAPTSLFGGFSPPSATPFGAPASTFPFQQQHQQPQSSAFHDSNTRTPLPFGTSSTSLTPFMSSSSNTLSATTTNPFGQQPQLTSTSGSIMAFGTSANIVSSSSAVSTSSGFGNTATLFGNSSNTAATTTTPTTTAFFGSNTNNTSNNFGGGAGLGTTTTFFPFGATSSNQQSDLDMRTTSPVPTPFGFSRLSPQSISPMRSGGHSDSEAEMGDGDQSSAMDNTKKSSNLPFGKPLSSSSATMGTTFSSSATVWGSSTSNQPNYTSNILAPGTTTSSPFNPTSLSPVPEMEASMTDSSGGPNTVASIHANNERLAELKANLEQKKKKLEEKKNRSKKDDDDNNNNNNNNDKQDHDNDFNSKKKQPSNEAAFDVDASAEKNARRFGTNVSKSASELIAMSATERQQPSQQQQQQQQQQQYHQQTSTGREELVNAVSLVGTCLNMCPDEEIMRRERENDIQLLEKPLPGIMHPPSWTIRDTMVKRFRRSAADYKLDVPEWVRPPDVLERVCGYLEEWVMERDRQGPDQRFIDSEFNFKHDGTPPSLDVYQFIWDRTRMVRKDFILQNYVGTGGNCDARAVRCHERIVRWHAMCEHQLSHIPEFVSQQSQQNIQELGQAMKTLNQYYDDALNRSIVEVPDEYGNETRTDLSAFNHGCSHNTVQGRSPVDFDQKTLLMNDDDSMDPNSTIHRRLIGGKAAVMSRHHGTAEPEMRGLYILLTLENDGGMEVLKYAARLYQLRPHVYQTMPVQLALNVYKARKEGNYARFFSILRASSTPYLFACVMFKYVEVMRRFAFRIMSKTYGGKSREGDVIYDEYVLRDLTHLLCFESDDETRSACRHYNITVQETNGVEVIYWKRSSFRDPKDPDKGTVIKLLPRKMSSTIESKIRGVTRLAVCRGEVSGYGAFLTNLTAGLTAISPEEREKLKRELDEARLIEIQKQKQLLQQAEAEAEASRLRKEEAKRKQLELQERLELERKKKDEQERQKVLEEQRQNEIKERERLERQKLELEAEQRRIEQNRIAELKRAEEAEKERQREVLRLEAIRREKEELLKAEKARKEKLLREEAENLRQLEEKMRREEAERLRIQKEKAEILQKEQERLRLEALQHEREQQDRVKLERARLRREAQLRSENAKKKLVLLRWMKKLPRHVCVHERVVLGLERISPLAQSSLSSRFFDDGSTRLGQNGNITSKSLPRMDLRRTLERLLKHHDDFTNHLTKCIVDECNTNWKGQVSKSKETHLLKVAVVLPIANNDRDQAICDLTRTWINSRLRFGRISYSETNGTDIRVVIADSHDKDSHPQCDTVMFVVPPPWSDSVRTGSSRIKELKAMASSVSNDIPRIVFVLCEQFHNNWTTRRHQLIAPIFTGAFPEVLYLENSDLTQETIDSSLLSVCELVATSLYSYDPFIVERTSVARLAFRILSEAGVFHALDEDFDSLFQKANILLQTFIAEVDDFLSKLGDVEVSWPSSEFTTTDPNAIDNYFESDIPLPLDWLLSLSRPSLETECTKVSDMLRGSISDVVKALIATAPSDIRTQCYQLLDQRMNTRCLLSAFQWKVRNDEARNRSHTVYLPLELSRDIVQRTVDKYDELTQSAVTNVIRSFPDSASVTDVSFVGDIDKPPTETQSVSFEIQSPEVTGSQWSNNTSKADKQDCPILSDRNSTQKSSPLLPKTGSKRHFTDDENESIKFTKRLKRLLAGEEIVDMVVGTSTLATLLKSASPLKLSD